MPISQAVPLITSVLQVQTIRPEAAAWPPRRSPYRLRQPDGIFLTHAHMGHIGGLPQLGPEAMAITQLPIYASRELGHMLLENALHGRV